MSAITNFTITASIVNYRTAHLLDACLVSLAAAVPQLTHVVIVDHSDEDISLHTSLPHTVIRAENEGFGAGHNRAVDFLVNLPRFSDIAADQHLHLFLNPDALLPENFLSLFSAFSDDSVGMVGPALIDTDGTLDPYAAGRFPTFLRLIGNHLSAPALPEHAAAVDWVSGAACVTRISAFRAVSGFNPAYFLYYEDVDLCKRLSDSGFSVIFDPSVHVIHDSGQSFSDFSDQTTQKRYYDAGQDRFFSTYYSAPHAAIQRCVRGIFRFLSR